MTIKTDNSTIVAVKDTGRLHLGYEEEGAPSVGLGSSIYTYDNCITKLYGLLMNNVTRIEADGKIFWASRASFNKHLKSIGLNEDLLSRKTNKVAYQDLIAQNKDRVKMSDQPMSNRLSSSLREKLFVALATAVTNNDTDSATNLIRHGAYLNRRFYCDTNRHVKFSEYLTGSLEHGFYRYEVGFVLESLSQHTPLTIAILNDNQELARKIYYAKSGNVVGDRRHLYKKNVTSSTDGFSTWKLNLSTSENVHVTIGDNGLPLLSLK